MLYVVMLCSHEGVAADQLATNNRFGNHVLIVGLWRRALQPRSLFSPSHNRRQNQTSAAGVATPPRARRPANLELAACRDPLAGHDDGTADKAETTPTGCRTPVMRRVMGTQPTAISPAHSEDARQLMFLAMHTSCDEVSLPPLLVTDTSHVLFWCAC